MISLAAIAWLWIAQAPASLSRGIELFHQHQFAGAEREFRRLAAPPARLYLTRTLIEQGSIAEAIAEIELLLAKPVDAETRFRAGEILRDLAQRRLAALNRSTPDSAAVLEMNAANLERSGRWEDALALYRQATRKEPSRPGLHYRIGAALWRLRDLDGAEKALATEIGASPFHGMANLRLGQVLLTRHDAARAIGPLEIAAQAVTQSIEPQRELGKPYRKDGVQQSVA